MANKYPDGTGGGKCAHCGTVNMTKHGAKCTGPLGPKQKPAKKDKK